MNIGAIGKQKLILVMLVVAFALRFAWGIYLDPHQLYFPDSQQWNRIALNFLSGNGLIIDEGAKALRPPVYSLFLSFIYFVFGKENLLAVRIIQALISSCTCLIVYLLGKKIFNETTAKISMAACAIYPFFIYYSGAVLTETLYIFILSLIMLFLSGKRFMWAGILFGLGILCRPELIVFFFCAFAGMFIVLRKKEALKRAIIMTAIAGAILFPWMLRNYLVLHACVPLTTMSGYTFYEGNGPRNPTGGPVSPLLFPDTQGMSEIEKDRFLKQEAIRAIRENPRRMTGLLWSKFKRLWNIRLNTDNPAYASRLTVLASMISFTPVLILFIIGFVVSWRRRRELIYVYFLILHTTVINLAFVSSLRYRLPLEPFMIIVASYALVVVSQRIGAQRTRVDTRTFP